MKRRQVLFGAGSIAAAGAVWLALRHSGQTPAGVGTELAQRSDAFLDAVCDLVIPDTDTPGARRAGVPQFVVMAAEHQLAGCTAADIAALRSLLDRAASGSFLTLAPAQQYSVLEKIDAATDGDTLAVWRRIKKLILMGYYTSEIGASQELQYQLVPGRFDPDLPVKPGDRAWSSDWIGQGF